MLRHPFHGVIDRPEDSTIATELRDPTNQNVIARRSFFTYSLATMAGAAAWLLGRAASAQPPWDPGRGVGFPEGGALQGGYGGAVRTSRPGGAVTTFAIGEEGGGIVTTQAVGEEGGGIITTQAVGEEGGTLPPRRRPRRVTTFALGEEGGSATTYALGEEGGGVIFRR